MLQSIQTNEMLQIYTDNWDVTILYRQLGYYNLYRQLGYYNLYRQLESYNSILYNLDRQLGCHYTNIWDVTIYTDKLDVIIYTDNLDVTNLYRQLGCYNLYN